MALAAGPYVRRGAVDSNHYNHTSLVRTIQEIFGIPPSTRALAMNWAQPDDIPSQVLNRILWWEARGYETPYPALK